MDKTKAKPFIKWVGGKGQLLEQLDSLLPVNFESLDDVTYIEPFVGGGAMLFYMLQRYRNIKCAVINDINERLITCYKVVRDTPTELILLLSELQNEYYSLETEEDKKFFYYQKRERFNSVELSDIEQTALFILLNRTCFNGLYRENKSGKFNVPFGKHVLPMICDTTTLYKDSKLLQNVEILSGDFENTLKFAHKNTVFYFDPPYRPLSETSCFNDYTKESFNDPEQLRLKRFCDRIHQLGYMFMLSNSDSVFFDELYKSYLIERVYATRNVNAVASKRGRIAEIVVRNYTSNIMRTYASCDFDNNMNIVAEKTISYGF